MKIENSIHRSTVNDQAKTLDAAAGMFRTPEIGDTSSTTEIAVAIKTELQQ